MRRFYGHIHCSSSFSRSKICLDQRLGKGFPDEVVRLEGEVSLNAAETGAIRTRANILNEEVEGGKPAGAYRRFTDLVTGQHILVDAPEGIGGGTLVIAFVAFGKVYLTTQAAAGLSKAPCQAFVADHFLGATGAIAQPQGLLAGFAGVGKDGKAGEGLTCQVVVARKGWVYCGFSHIEGKI
jgi:hypothetical protein